jgi:hypothetical protein
MPEEQRSKLFDAAAGAGAGSFPPPHLHPIPLIFSFVVVVAAAGYCLVSVVCARTQHTDKPNACLFYSFPGPRETVVDEREKCMVCFLVLSIIRAELSVFLD